MKSSDKRISNIYYLLIIFISVFLKIDSFAQALDSASFLSVPTGSYKIGTKDFYITDSNRYETYNRKKTHRSLSVKVWYPVDSQIQMKKELYMASIPTDVLYETFKPKGIRKTFLDSIKQFETYSFDSPPLSSSQEKFPVLVFSSGYYFGISELYSSMIENLASNGYIIFALTHPYEQPYIKTPSGEEIFLNKKKTRLAYLQLLIFNTFRRNRTNTFEEREEGVTKSLKRLKRFDRALQLWTQDTEFFIDYMFVQNKCQKDFYCKIDTTKIGLFGHSFGGAVAGQMCSQDKRVKAGINIDCFQFGTVIDNPIPVPFMLIQSTNYPSWNIGNEVVYSFNKAKFYKLSVLNTTHFIFSDAAVIPFENQQVKMDFIKLEDGMPAINTVNNYILKFFDLYLKNQKQDLLNQEIDSPEIKFEFNSK